MTREQRNIKVGERVWVESERTSWGAGTVVSISESMPETHIRVNIEGEGTRTFARRICTPIAF